MDQNLIFIIKSVYLIAHVNGKRVVQLIVGDRMKYTSLVISLLVATSAHAATRVSLQHLPATDLKYMLMPNESLHLLKEHIDKNGTTHRRMQQMYLGFPVVGGYAILHHAQSKQSMNGAIYRDLQTDLGVAKADFVPRAKKALQAFKSAYMNQTIQDEHITPVVYVDEQQHAFWAYQVSLLVEPANAMPKRPSAIIDAQTFKPFVVWDDIKTLKSSEIIKTSRSPALGIGFGGNQHMGQYQYGRQLPLLSILRDDYTEMCYLENKRVKVVDMDYSTTKSNVPMAFNCPLESEKGNHTFWTGYNNDGYDLVNGGYSPSNDALYVGDVIKNMYKEWYDLDVLMQGKQPMQLVMRVHFSKKYENAFWDGRQMTFGDGASLLYPVVSLTVGAHEVSHGFTEQHSNLAYYGQSGGMNESFSDMAAQAAEYYAKKASTWKIGAEIVKEGSGYQALRYMDKPSKDGRSIDKVSQYRKGMDVHWSSGVYNRLFYLLANTPGWNSKKAFQVMVKANMDYWTPTTTFDEGACGVINATEDFTWSIDDVTRAMDMVGIDYSDCE